MLERERERERERELVLSLLPHLSPSLPISHHLSFCPLPSN
uniref:Uncharacterized protein n=1 Tax=Arundo donax TaxID=35708 RepID=A0A0A9BK61_ARUDO